MTTPSNEIDELVRDIMQVPYSKHKAKAAIEAYTAQAAIDELKHCCEDCGYWHIDKNSPAMTFSERIVELEQSLKEVK